MSRMRRARHALTVIALATVPLAAGALVAQPAAAVPSTRLSTASTVSEVPGAGTPAVQNGVVNTVVQVGSTIVVGGSFTRVGPASGGTVVRNRVFAFTLAHNAITAFAPRLDGAVDAVYPGPGGRSVYVAGEFQHVNGRAVRGLVLLDLASGRTVRSFVPPKLDNAVNDLQVVGSRLLLAGFFTSANGAPRAGLAAVSASSGALLPYLSVQLTGHHNYGVQCKPSAQTKCAWGRTGARAFSVSPDGRYLVVTGNFRTARNGTRGTAYARDQFVRIRLGTRSATVDARFTTRAFAGPCSADLYDSWVRNVSYSPDGKYFVVVGTGGPHPLQSCDAALRFENAATGTVRPTWIDRTGGDSLSAVAVTNSSVYVGGHERWMNNPFGLNNARAGAVPRPGLAALDPVTGLPLSWDPGRYPRGVGTQALTLTPRGLWVGSDTRYIGLHQYLRPRLAFFRFTGRQPLPGAVATLPGEVVTVGAGPQGGTHATAVSFDGHTASNEHDAGPAGVDWNTARGAVGFDGVVLYGQWDGTTSGLYVRTFDGSTWGGPLAADPYQDARWPCGLQGVPSNFLQQVPDVTSMWLWQRRLYYTLDNDPSHLHWRAFSPDSLTVAATQQTVAVSGVDWAAVRGAFLAGGSLYWATAADGPGTLQTASWNGGHPGPASTEDTGSYSWAGRGMFVVPPHASSGPHTTSPPTGCTTG